MEASAIVAGTSKLEAAKTLLDWTITKKANEMYNVGYAVVAYPGVAKPVPHFPENLIDKMIDNDFEFAANNRARILEEWQKRYDSKSEPKRSEEHTSELQSLMRISYAVFCLKKKKKTIYKATTYI